MEEILNAITRLLTEVVMPNLKAAQAGQAQQIETTRKVERDIEALRVHLQAQFAQMTAQLTACRAELAATQAMLKAAGAAKDSLGPKQIGIVH